uniref:Mannose-binding lectin n=1 Tax=Curcuma longa TaxID=136217 RepID=A0A0U2EZG6_CURLO|nr:mannose-binding lectin precursor [Curcuma longa]
MASKASVIILSAAIFLGLLPSALSKNILLSGETLETGKFLTEGEFTFLMQSDCNLVLYDLNRPIWSSGTIHKGSGCILKMQNDGNLVIYNVTNNAIWASNTGGQQGNYILILQRDRNVVIYSQPIFNTDTAVSKLNSSNLGETGNGGNIAQPENKIAIGASNGHNANILPSGETLPTGKLTLPSEVATETGK